MLYSLFLILSLLSFPANDMHDGSDSLLEGYWHGEMFPDEKGYAPIYTIDMYLKEKDGEVTGYSYISVDNIYAKMKIRGSLSNDILLNAEDLNIMDSEVNPGMEWCMKNYFLILKKEDNIWKLEGHWNGTTSFSTCTPGKVVLKKIIPRA